VITKPEERIVMNINKMLEELTAERTRLDEAIITLRRLAVGSGRSGKRRGRPPAWMSDLVVGKRRGRPPGSKNKTSAKNLSAAA
jgi:hypothetical protein